MIEYSVMLIFLISPALRAFSVQSHVPEGRTSVCNVAKESESSSCYLYVQRNAKFGPYVAAESSCLTQGNCALPCIY